MDGRNFIVGECACDCVLVYACVSVHMLARASAYSEKKGA